LSDEQKAQLKGCIASIIRQARDAPYKVRQGWAQNVECLNNITDKTIDRYSDVSEQFIMFAVFMSRHPEFEPDVMRVEAASLQDSITEDALPHMIR
jgi:hypothetical protein